MNDTNIPANILPTLCGLFLACTALANALLGYALPGWQVPLAFALSILLLLVL